MRVRAVANLVKPVPTEDDVVDSAYIGRPQAFTAEDLVKLRVCPNFWIEVGNLHRNRGPGVPGDQLMLRRLSRVYFGFPATDLHTDSLVGQVDLTYRRAIHVGRTLRFSNNSMDVLSLPVPGIGAPAAYDGQTIRFERVGDRAFTLVVGTSAEVRAWSRASDAVNARFTMTSGRQFGVF
jgi:hypothetical protein